MCARDVQAVRAGFWLARVCYFRVCVRSCRLYGVFQERGCVGGALGHTIEYSALVPGPPPTHRVRPSDEQMRPHTLCRADARVVVGYFGISNNQCVCRAEIVCAHDPRPRLLFPRGHNALLQGVRTVLSSLRCE